MKSQCTIYLLDLSLLLLLYHTLSVDLCGGFQFTILRMLDLRDEPERLAHASTEMPRNTTAVPAH